MDMSQFIEKTIEQTQTTFEKLPDIDLYMDQVIEYLAKHCSADEYGDKISGAMINNYIKDKILPRTIGKRYGKIHLACLMMIARLKSVLTVKDIGLLVGDFDEENISEYFDVFQEILFTNTNEIKNKIPSETENMKYTALEFAVSAYVNKMACEMILEQIGKNKENNDVDD